MATSSKRYVFLVDDEPIQNEMLKDYLTERFIYELVTFENGENALEKMDLQPEIIILDYHLNSHNPQAKNGVDILKEIKEHWPDTYVIMLSGQDRIDVAIDTMRYGAYDYVVKGESAFSRVENIMNNINDYMRVKALNVGYRNTITLLTIVIGLIILISVYHFYLKHLFFN
ncbi:MAG TPA: response regulator [Chitinophagaceae bacterium]|nr:response regulator [Chitinophagaceae bacterium]